MYLRAFADAAHQANHATISEIFLPPHAETASAHAQAEAAYMYHVIAGATAVLTLFAAYFAYYHTKTTDYTKAALLGAQDIYLTLLTVSLKLSGKPQAEIQAKIQAERDIFISAVAEDPDETLLPY